jgi:hypothetical protein
VHAEVAYRLIPIADLAAAIATLGCDHDSAALAEVLDVDRETVRLRLAQLGRAERAELRSRLRRAVSTVA